MMASHRDQMFELMSQGVWQVDAAGKTIYANSRMSATVGYTLEEFLLVPSLSLVRAEDRSWIAARIASRQHGIRDDYECQIAHKDGSWAYVLVEAVPLYRDDGQFDGTIALVTDISDRRRREDALAENERLVMASGMAQEIEEVVWAPDGERILQTAKAPLRDDDGRVVGIVGCARDVTERKRGEEALRTAAQALQQSESQMQVALAMGHAGTWRYNVKTAELWGSAEGLRIFGYPPVAGNWSLEDIEVCIPERERVHHALVALLEENSQYALEYVIQPADGAAARTLYSVATVVRDADGSPVEVVGFVQDITERKRAEDDLRRLAAELTEANRLKDIFTDVLRHDIINPASAIQNATDVLLIRESDAMKTEVLRGIRHAAANLIEMTDLASKLAAVAAGDGLAFFPANPVDALQSAVEDLAHTLTEKNITLVNHSGPGFSAHFHPLMKQVFANFISNAIKYSPDGTQIDICAEEDRSESWLFFVKDQGIGVPDAYKQTIFHRFARLGRDGVRGTGLGLAIAEQIVGLHRGLAWVEDNPSGGSIFYVRLPKMPG